jgi:NAD-dependent deacetylase
MLRTVITQNVDGLHQAAGNTDVIEFHGTFTRQRCTDCAALSATRDVDLSRLPPRCRCGGVLRPDWVFFGEMIPYADLERARESAAACDLMLVIGTSASVQPAAYLPVIARDASARVIEINAEATPLTATVSDYLIQGRAEAVVDQILGVLDRGPEGPHPE